MNKEEGSLSGIDRAILKVLLDTNDGKRSSMLLSRRLGVPATTILRRRKPLEKDFLELSYSLNLKKFGWRRVDLLISTRNGKTNSVGNGLLLNEEVVYVGKSIGEHTIDLRAEVIIKDNAQLLVVGRKRSIPSGIIDKL